MCHNDIQTYRGSPQYSERKICTQNKHAIKKIKTTIYIFFRLSHYLQVDGVLFTTRPYANIRKCTRIFRTCISPNSRTWLSSTRARHTHAVVGGQQPPSYQLQKRQLTEYRGVFTFGAALIIGRLSVSAVGGRRSAASGSLLAAAMTPDSMIQDLTGVVTYIAGGGLSRRMQGPTKARVVRKMSAPSPHPTRSRSPSPLKRQRKHSIPSLYQRGPSAWVSSEEIPLPTIPQSPAPMSYLSSPPIMPQPVVQKVLKEPRKSLSSSLDVPLVKDNRARKYSMLVTRGDMKNAPTRRPLNAKNELMRKLTGVLDFSDVFSVRVMWKFVYELCLFETRIVISLEVFFRWENFDVGNCLFHVVSCVCNGKLIVCADFKNGFSIWRN